MTLVMLLTIAVATITHATLALHPLSDEYIDLLNSKQSSWEAGRNFPADTPLSDIRKLMGVLKESRNVTTLPLKVHVQDAVIPESFDARTNWPKCPIIKLVRDQSACGSCWAIAAVSAMSDRICIHSNGAKQISLSAADLMACCWWECGHGCDGGYPKAAWEYWVKHGIVSGGEYDSKVGCKPYPFPQCEHHSTGAKKPCQGNYDTPKCFLHCDSPSEIDYKQDKIYGESSYSIGNHVQHIQLEIMKNGPVEASFDVFNDFLSYKKGVYVKTDRNMIGGHAVRIIGWGTENNVAYWLVANSWNEDWGDKGFFKIRRGTNECYIESSIVAGLPKL